MFLACRNEANFDKFFFGTGAGARAEAVSAVVLFGGGTTTDIISFLTDLFLRRDILGFKVVVLVVVALVALASFKIERLSKIEIELEDLDGLRVEELRDLLKESLFLGLAISLLLLLALALELPLIGLEGVSREERSNEMDFFCLFNKLFFRNFDNEDNFETVAIFIVSKLVNSIFITDSIGNSYSNWG